MLNNAKYIDILVYSSVITDMTDFLIEKNVIVSSLIVKSSQLF